MNHRLLSTRSQRLVGNGIAAPKSRRDSTGAELGSEPKFHKFR